MNAFQVAMAVIAAIMLFLFALRGFSQELQTVGGDALKRSLARITGSRWGGFLTGALATALVQSSSAVSAILIAFVDAGAIGFTESLAVLLGANVGTTSTAWLVSMRLTGLGPFFIVLGGLVSLVPFRIRVLGQAIFYFGFIFFALDTLNGALGPLREQPLFLEWLARADDLWIALLFGIVFTAVVQSSSVAVGVCILFVQQGLLPPASAVAIVVGANIGTTSTALIASMQLSEGAKATAWANFLFNLAGVLLYLPFLHWFADWLHARTSGPTMTVVWAHLIFNLSVALLFLLFLGRLAPVLKSWLFPNGNQSHLRQ
ncbi:MAG: Na/Pi cotransporter family protein [Flavobacteriales bacterium]|nr:Na/Pi cotransporter family protein [Flavobacteriales bacterium]